MFHKSRVHKQLEIVVTIVFYAVILSLLVVIASSFSKEICARYAADREAKIMTAGELPLIVPAYENQSTPSIGHNAKAENGSYTSPESKPVIVFPCEVTVIEEPVEHVSAEYNTIVSVKDPFFSVPLDAELQNHIVEVCKKYEVDPALVVSVIHRESGYNHLAIGDNGASEGLMQIKREFHRDRMARLGCTDLLDPKQNILVGVDILAELLNTYETTEMALMVYNAGATGAYTYWFSNGVFSTEYSRSVLAMVTELHHENALAVSIT